MIRTSIIALAAITMALSACQPQKPAEPATVEPAAVRPVAPDTASTQANPAASAYLAGADKVFALLADVKDVAAVEAVKPQVTAIYAEMATPAAALKAMTPEQRTIAFGSEAVKGGVLDKVGATLARHSYNPETLQAVGALIDQMPKMD